MSTQRMFIYGTLMRGETNHHLLGEAHFVAEVSTEPGFALVGLGWYPAMVREGEGCVHGELFDVPLERLPELDAYEDCPGLYERVRIPIEGHGEAETYLIPATRLQGRPRIPGGDWRRRGSVD